MESQGNIIQPVPIIPDVSQVVLCDSLNAIFQYPVCNHSISPKNGSAFHAYQCNAKLNTMLPNANYTQLPNKFREALSDAMSVYYN